MRTVNSSRYLILILLLAVTAFLVHGRTGMAVGSAVTPKAPLRDAFAGIRDWKSSDDQILSEQIISGLMLDDYLFRSFSRGREKLTLYIGYYRTAAKVGAAHDPTVCFNGQGWQIGAPSHGTYKLTSSPGPTVSYSSMVADRHGEREIIVYWFQTGGSSSSNTFSQKVDMVRARLLGHGEDNAFIRITSPVGDESPEAARKRIFSFIENFYPIFHVYVTGS